MMRTGNQQIQRMMQNSCFLILQRYCQCNWLRLSYGCRFVTLHILRGNLLP